MAISNLLTGRVRVISPKNVTADRYQFIDLSQVEPNFGVPNFSASLSGSPAILVSDDQGNRGFVRSLDLDRATGTFTGSFTGSAQSLSGSFSGSFTGSFIGDGSRLVNLPNVTFIASGSATASFVEGDLLVNTNARIQGDLYVDDTIYAESIIVSYISSSVIYSSGSNILGDNSGSDVQKIFGETQIFGNVSASAKISSSGFVGDGAGLLIDIPHDYFKRVCDFSIPNQREYAVGMVFLPKVSNQYDFCKTTFEKELKIQGLAVLGWREVPVDSCQLGEIALASEPNIEQLFIGKTDKIDEATFKAKLYAARKIAEHTIRKSKISESNYFYIPSLSITTIIYKGIIMPEDIGPYYKDLQEIDLVTRLALVHQRFSTNTMPTWELAQPFRHMCQNGEINTLRGNVSRMRVREEIMKSDVFGPQIDKLFPIILPGKSDSASMDMVVELLTHTGRSLPEIMMMMIPEAWEKHKTMSKERKAFYEYNGCIMEPWDGPASVPFTDGDYIGALLDRNGLRPSRYTVTKSGKLIMSSEIGVVDVAPEDVKEHGRLEPGKMFLVDMNKGRIIEDEEIKKQMIDANQMPSVRNR